MKPERAKWIFSVPSKTFLFGEYAVLDGGPSVLLAHRSRFRLMVEHDGQGACSGIHPQSPAGRWMRQNAAVFSDFSLSFFDPHEGRGGFGASSAQFALVYALAQVKAGQGRAEVLATLNKESLWKAFRDLHAAETVPPSGADVMAQILGGATAFQMMPWQARSAPWPFLDLTVLLIPTGFKVATHEHLRERLPATDSLIQKAEAAFLAFKNKNSPGFVAALKQYAEELESLQLVTTNTRGLIAQVAALPHVQVVKGCGALGADVLAVVTSTSTAASVENLLAREGLYPVGRSDELEEGLKFEVELAPFHATGELEWA